MAVTPDNSTLIVAESYGQRLTAFDIAADGSLSNRRVWADLGDGVPDGICLDADGAVWYADVPNQRCVRVGEGGEVLQTDRARPRLLLCALGGPDGRTLFDGRPSGTAPISAGAGTGVLVATSVDEQDQPNQLRRRRRIAGSGQPSELLRVGEVELDPGTRTVLQRGKPVELTSVEFNLLHVLLGKLDAWFRVNGWWTLCSAESSRPSIAASTCTSARFERSWAIPIQAWITSRPFVVWATSSPGRKIR